MSKVMATNGKTIRSMGVIELKNNPDWRLATEADIAAFSGNPIAVPPAPGKAVREPGPMRLDTKPAPESTPQAEEPERVVVRPEVVEATPEALEQAAEQAATPEPAPVKEPLAIVIGKIKKCTTKEQVEALTVGEDRKTVIDIAAKHILKLSKA